MLNWFIKNETKLVPLSQPRYNTNFLQNESWYPSLDFLQFWETRILTFFEFTTNFFIPILLKFVQYKNQNEILVSFSGNFSNLTLEGFLTSKLNLKCYYMKLRSKAVLVSFTAPQFLFHAVYLFTSDVFLSLVNFCIEKFFFSNSTITAIRRAI